MKKTFNPRVNNLKQSGIRSASARCAELGGINLGQGICDIPVQETLKQAAYNAIQQDKSLYGPHRGLTQLREALADKIKKFNRVDVNPDTEILVSHGSTGSYVSAIKTLFNPGDEVILFEPFYGYHKNLCELFDIMVKAVKMGVEDFSINFADVEKQISEKTKGIVLCTPCNPSGKVFSKEELIAIGELAKKHQLYVITDEIYEYITYPGHEHVSLASLNDYFDHTITISGFSKTYNVTGWRVGYAYGPEDIIHKMALVHDLLYICPVTPLQHALLEGLSLSDDYYHEMREKFLHNRNFMTKALREMGFKVPDIQGAYYLMADISDLNKGDDQAVAHLLLEQAKVAVVGGQYFYLNPADGNSTLRFCFALEFHKLEKAIEDIRKVL